MIIVWHANGLRYQQVAALRTNDLETAFGASQHTDELPWQKGPLVAAYAVGPQRSTSVGDVLEVVSIGQRYRVESRGFAPVVF